MYDIKDFRKRIKQEGKIMYFEHSKRSYYRFPSKNSVTDFDTQAPYYFPEKNSVGPDELYGSFQDSNYYNYDDFHDHTHEITL
jgi:hypothetical protein